MKIVNFINSTALNVKFIIAPHNIKDEQIQNSKQHQPKNCFILWKKKKT
jgi:3-deoxy-D-manno-octulosonic-acid transferase